MTEFKYKAFISYSHADEKWARWLHRALESYRPPKHLIGKQTPMGQVPAKMSPVFRDREELASSTDLGADLNSALEASACLVVICSIPSAGSHWVNEEIKAFKSLGRSDRIFSLIVEGEPFSSGKPGIEQYECFPPALRFKMGSDGGLSDEPAEPIAADARQGRDRKGHAKVKLLAGMLGVGLDDLRQRELQRRNRRMAIFSGAAVTGMVFAIGLATTAIIARNEAQQQRARAEQEAETARRTASFMIDMFQVSDPGESRGKTITAREILSKGATRIEVDLADQPEIQTSLMNTMGNVFIGLGLYNDAQQLLEKSLARRRTLPASRPQDMNESLYNLANVKTLTADYEIAEKLYLEAIATLEEAGRSGSLAAIDNLAGLAELYIQMGRYEQAGPILREVLERRRRVLGPEDPAVAEATEELGLSLFYQGEYEGAEPLLQEALKLRRKLLGSEPHPDLAENMNSLALVLQMLGRIDETQQLYEQALAMNRQLYGEKHPNIALALNNLADLYLDSDELDKAEGMFQQALVMQRELFGEEHPEVALVMNNLAYVYYYRGDMPEAMEAMRTTVKLRKAALGDEHPDVAVSLSTLGRWEMEAGDYAAAKVALEEALAQQLILLDPDHEMTAITRMRLAELYSSLGRFTQALAAVEAAASALERSMGKTHWYTALASNIHGSILGNLGRNTEAETLLLSSYQQLADDGRAVGIYVVRSLERVIEFYRASGNQEALARYQALYARGEGAGNLAGGAGSDKLTPPD
jgi:tetratricopeptide (TPR) repeat protein